MIQITPSRTLMAKLIKSMGNYNAYCIFTFAIFLLIDLTDFRGDFHLHFLLISMIIPLLCVYLLFSAHQTQLRFHWYGWAP